MTRRYTAQLCLPEIGEEGQEKLFRSCVIVVGAGGLGTALLPVLAGAGVGLIHIMDDDVVEEGNLHRQTLYRMDDIGKNKAECAAKHLAGLNPSVRIVPHGVGAQSDTVSSLLSKMCAEAKDHSGRVMVLDAADNFATTYMLSDLCRKESVPLVSASAIRWGGYAAIFCGTVPSYRAVFPVLSAMAQNCQTAGVLGSVVGLVGMLQAQLCLSSLLDIKPSPAGILYRWDAKNLRMTSFSFMEAEEPEEAWPFLAYSQLRLDDILVDVRHPDEQPEIIHPHLYHIPLDRFLRLEKWDFPRNERIVICCQSGVRANRAASHLHTYGYDRLALMAMRHQSIT
ncbi:HesA/MoeB/ThiF family protein [Acetobacteraceae bacterium ESL0709]|nr:HesA/MoeB/ThiF family protein [Acetobacteraceae bacterium ESL0697]MDF7678175.1 HesA/MoeB/ThiF family protein [Acetobacteraceae bacterium ESL0709]